MVGYTDAVRAKDRVGMLCRVGLFVYLWWWVGASWLVLVLVVLIGATLNLAIERAAQEEAKGRAQAGADPACVWCAAGRPHIKHVHEPSALHGDPQA